MKITIVEQNELEVWDDDLQEFVLNFKSKYYIVNGLGQYVFFHCRNRADAQKECDDMYGKSFYTVRQAKQGSGDGNYTCTGSNSRKGFASHLRKTI